MRLRAEPACSGGNIVKQNLGVGELANFVVADGFVAQQRGDVIDRLVGFLR